MTSRNEEFLDQKECSDLARVLDRRYAAHLSDRYFQTDVSRDEFGVYVKITLRNDAGSFVYPVEGRVAHEAHSMSHREAGLFLFDYIDAYFEEYFDENGEVYLPIDWSDYECDEVPLQLKGQILNLQMEKMADEILASGRSDTPVH